MIEIKGEFNTAKVFANSLDGIAAQQLQTMCDQAFLRGCRIRVMPDAHAGKGCTIGTTMTLHGRAVPNMVGVDIGCGMETTVLADRKLDLEALDRLVYAAIPSGTQIRKRPHPYQDRIDLRQLRSYGKINGERARMSVGTLGGGNHFIEVDRDEGGNFYLIIHSGSRHLGTEVAGWYQAEGYRTLCGSGKRRHESDIPRELAYVEGALFDDYLHDMRLTQRFALLNRQAMMDELIRGLGLTAVETISTIHNYIDTDAMILRKGAVSARAGERLLIPINMRDGSLLCVGRGNEDWNFSAPHGAGRLMSRKEAVRAFGLEAFRQTMEGVYTTSVGRGTLDECPMAYKGMAEIVDNIGPTADIVSRLRPVYNFKAGGRA